MHFAATFLAIALFAGHALAQDEAKALASFQRAFRPSPKDPPDAAARATALAGLAGLDSPAVAKALVSAHAQVEGEVEELDARRAAMLERLREIVKGQEFQKQVTLPQGLMDERKKLTEEVGETRTLVDGLRDLMTAIGQTVGELRKPETVSFLLDTVSGSRKHSSRLEVKVAQAAGAAGPAVLKELLAALQKAKAGEEIAALLDGVGIMGEGAKAAAPVVIALLQHPLEVVREHAALALSTLCDPAAIEPMIRLLATSHGQTKKRVAAHLEVLTRQQHGTSAATWERWFAAEGAPYVAGKMPLGGGTPSRGDDTKNYYFGIPQDGKSIIYIIDSSGSMAQKIKLRLPREEPPKDDEGGKGKGTVAKMRKEAGDGDASDAPRETTRLEACKEELIRALGRLEPTTRFNVIWYNSEPHLFAKQMLDAGEKEIRAAQAWVRKLQPASNTNIHDSLQMAFTLTGGAPGGAEGAPRGPLTGKAAIKQQAANPDTIFLLSDGAPTKPPGDKPDSTEKIINAVRSWNALKSVVVHCIGIGDGINAGFMSQLASENGGEFKQY